MAEFSHAPVTTPQPPPAPPLPPNRGGGVFQKFIAPLSFNLGVKQHGTQITPSTGVNPSTNPQRANRLIPSQTTAHRTGIPIAALDINKARTHAILAGQEILKTVHVQDGYMVEDFNLRSGINSYISAKSETANHRREYLPAKDVVWSKGEKYSNVIATAATNGRIALYDVSRLNSARIELAWIHEHTGQVNKLDFDPTGGYYLLSGSQDKTVKIWDIRESQSVKRKQSINIRQPVRDVRWSPTDPGEFALCTENGIVQRWDLRMPNGALLSINAHEKACYSIDWHPDGRHLVSGGFDKYAKVWDLKSDNRRQKPTFSLRTPQAILNVRWRPPCWSSNLAEKGHWQSAQLATSYTEDDPRIHIWDLRRPLVPFREHDKYISKPTDFLWASQDYLWSVGNQGMFQQTDVRYASLVHDEIPTTLTAFMPDSGFMSFSEDTRVCQRDAPDDAAAGFLRIPQERLSGGTDGMISRSLSDNDDEGEEGYLTTSVRRHLSRSSRSAKSQGNTPPAGDNSLSILSLDRSVLNRNGMFNNEQFGVASNISGISIEVEIIEFLAENYAQPMTEGQRKKDPAAILEKLSEAFETNAGVCDQVSMHRTAQTWRVLSAVVVPELADWAKANRKARLENEEKRQPVSSDVKSELLRPIPSHLKLTKSKVVNSLLKGVSDSHVRTGEVESTSNMTTPMARPLLELYESSDSQGTNDFLNLSETIEHIQPLPPSIVSSLSTAAAASRALLETSDENSLASSPEQPRRIYPPSQHRRAVTDLPSVPSDQALHLQSPKPQHTLKQVSSPLVPLSPRMELRKQEDRRAAIRDFRAQQRQLLNFDDPIQSPKVAPKGRHDSNESFTMFSASTDSSHRARSLGQSLDPSISKQLSRQDSDDWQSPSLAEVSEPSRPSLSRIDSQTSRNSEALGFADASMEADFIMDETSRLDFGLDGAAESVQRPNLPKPSAAASIWNMRDLPESSRSETSASSLSEATFSSHGATHNQTTKIFTTNPIRKLALKDENVDNVASVEENDPQEHEDMNVKSYIYTDFRPIDFRKTDPKLPFAWSALPLICHSIAFDMSEGIANAQFSVHLLMHLFPFFFNPALQVKFQPDVLPPDSIAERLMRPDLNHRIIQGLFLTHFLYLKKMGLFKSMAELRKVGSDFGFGELLQPGSADQPVDTSLKRDQFHLQTSCSYCFSFTQSGAVICQSCQRPRSCCTICLQLVTQNHGLNVFCQACGHGAHWSCMQEWMLQPDAEGQCPSRGCDCDCGPGLARQQRMARLMAEAEATDMIRGGRIPSIPKKDPVRASHSPAVDKTRDSLRTSDLARDSSGDETMRRSFSARGGTSRGGGMSISGGTSRGPNQSFGRRVRLVTPGEESGPSYSAS